MAKNTGTFLSGLLVGGAVGTVVGLLMAPRSGQETRKILQKSAEALPELAEDLSTTVQLQADRLSGEALHRWEGTLVRLREAIAAGVDASQLEAQHLNRAEDEALSSPSIPDRS